MKKKKTRKNYIVEHFLKFYKMTKPERLYAESQSGGYSIEKEITKLKRKKK